MKKQPISELTIDQLVARFVEIGIAQYEALDYNEPAKYRRLFKEERAILNELTARPGDGRYALLPLLHHPNAQVRLASAYATVAIAPAESRAAFEQLVRAREFPQAGDAGIALEGLDLRAAGKPRW